MQNYYCTPIVLHLIVQKVENDISSVYNRCAIDISIIDITHACTEGNAANDRINGIKIRLF